MTVTRAARTGRDRALELLRRYFGSTEVGRGFGVDRIGTLADLRATVPLMDANRHEREVESKLGFGVIDAHDPRAPELVGSARERENVVGVWRAYFADSLPTRVALLRGHHVDPLVDRILIQDLQALGGELLHIEGEAEAAEILQQLLAFDPEILVVPSVLTVSWLEQVHRGPLERKLPSLRMILAEHDMTERIRSRCPIESSGWIHRSGRMGLPSLRQPRSGLVLAVGTQILELLPLSDPEQAERLANAKHTILPEHALVGQRYELVITSPLGYLRLRTGEHVRVVGFDAPSTSSPFPRPRIVRLPPAPGDVRLEGCTLAGPWLSASVRQAFRREDPALVAGEIGPDPEGLPIDGASSTASIRLPSAFADTELGWLARTGAHRRHGWPRNLLIRVEVQGHVSRGLTRSLVERIDADLRRRSPAYAYLRDRGDLDRPRAMVLPAGASRAEQERRLRALLGAVWQPEVRVVA